MIRPNMKIDEVFEDGGRYFKIVGVNADGTYSSVATEKPAKVIDEPIVADEIKPKRTRSTKK